MAAFRAVFALVVFAACGGKGMAGTTFVNETGVLDVALQSDGKIVAAGTTTDGSVQLAFALVRLMPDGSLDPAFGDAGVVTTDVTSGCDFIRSVAVDAQGRIVVAGVTGSSGCLDKATADPVRVAVARYHPNGKLDSSFGAGGVVFPFEGQGTLAALALMPDGRVFVSGKLDGGDARVVRLAADGSIDPSFAVNGTYALAADPCVFGTPRALVFDGAFLYVAGGGSCATANPRGVYFRATKLTADGAVVAAYGTDGIASVFNARYGSGSAEAMALEPDGGVTLVGYSDDGVVGGTEAAFRIYHLDAAGQQKPSIRGTMSTRLANGVNRANRVVLNPVNHDVIAVGEAMEWGTAKGEDLFRSLAGLAAYGSNGLLDPAFSTMGRFTARRAVTDDWMAPYAAAAQPDGKVLAAGPSDRWIVDDWHFYLSFGVIRVNLDGTLDTTFGDQGLVLLKIELPGARRGRQTRSSKRPGDVLHP